MTRPRGWILAALLAGPALLIAGVVLIRADRSPLDQGPAPAPPRRLGPLRPGAPATPHLAAPPPVRTPYDRGIDAAARRGLRVWVEVELPTAWRAGGTRWRQTLDYVGGMAARPGVAGIKIADELGYEDGLRSQDEVVRFLRDARSALRRVAPGKRLMADFYVSDAGCLPGDPSAWARECAREFRRRHPRVTVEAVDRYLRTGALDVITYAPELPPDTFAGQTRPPDRTMRGAWAEALRRGWDKRVTLNGRLGAAFPGTYRGSRSTAEWTLHNELDIPLIMGACAVNVWTWQQRYEGRIYHLIDPGLRTNHLWRGLRDRRARGARLSTHFDPTIVDRSLDADLDVIKTVFTDILLMPGLGW